MDSYFETFRDKNNQIDFQTHVNEYNYETHFHHSIEILMVKKGKVSVFFNGEKKEVLKGNVFFFNSYDIHGYEGNGDILAYTLIIPSVYLVEFKNQYKNKKITNNLIEDELLTDKLISLCGDFNSKNSEYKTKSLINYILSLLEEKLSFSALKNTQENNLIREILIFISENYNKDISLLSISNRFGFCSEYVSRVFHKYFNYGIKTYINKLRLDHAQEELYKGRPILEAVLDSGFKSLSSYYRNKKSI